MHSKTLKFFNLFGCSLAVFLFGVYSSHVDLNDYYFTSSQVVSKQDLGAAVDCTDSNGVIYDHQQNWTDSGVCSRNICYKGDLSNYIIKFECRETTDSENPDKDNCEFITNLSYPFPHCCAVLLCSEGQTLTTTPDPGCIDRANNVSCSFWKDQSGCDPGSQFFNFTSIYCQKTCEFC